MDDEFDVFASDVMRVGVLMVTKDEPLINAIKIMSDKEIASVVVEDPDNFLQYYIISHSDIIDYLNHNKDQCIVLNQIKAKELMHPIDAIPPEMPLMMVIQLMLSNGLKRVIVVNDNQQPIGIISQADIMAWNNKLFQQGHPILICVMENDTGIILAQRFFREDFSAELLELFGGSISAITSITSEVLQKSGNLRIIEKDYYTIMLEPRDNITAILVVDHQSLDLRRKLQSFVERFCDEYKKELESHQRNHGPINAFKIKHIADNFFLE